MIVLKLFACMLIIAISFFSCDFSNLDKQFLEIQFPEIPKEKLWKGFHFRIVYYVSSSGKQSFATGDATSRRMQLRIYKGGILPVLACLQVDERFSFKTLGNASCPFASGALYPYDKAEIGIMRLQYGTKAKVARLMLLFHEREGNLRFLNMSKLYRTIIISQVSFIDEDTFFQSIARKKLGRPSIKAQKFFNVQISTEVQQWLDSWISVTSTQFLVTKKTARLPKGIWMFLNPKNDNYALISVSSQGKAMFSIY